MTGLPDSGRAATGADPTPPGGLQTADPPGPGLRSELRALARDPARYLLRLSGQGDVVCYRGGRERAYLVNRPELVRHVLVDNSSNYSKDTGITNIFRRVVNDGLFTSEGARWREQRRLLAPAFRHRTVAAIDSEVTAVVLRRLEGWAPAAASGTPIDIAEEMGAITLEVTVRVLFGADVADRSVTIVRLIAASLAAPNQAAERIVATAALDEMVLDILDQRRRLGSGRDDLLALLQGRTGDEPTLTDGEVRDQIITFVLAGYETTANALTWAWLLLAEHPDADRRMREEIAGVVGGRVATSEDCCRLAFTRAALMEALRLYPPAWVIGRRALADDSIGGCAIPAGSVVAISPLTIHRDPELWPDPEAFEPSRFLDGGRPGRERFAFIPFGVGPRHCIGQEFASVEALLILATVAQRFTLVSVPGAGVDPDHRFVLRPRSGSRMVPSPVMGAGDGYGDAHSARRQI